MGESLVNKRGETELQSTSKFFKPREGSDVLENKRLEYKFDKMKEQNIAYMMRHTDEECAQAADYFSVDSFEQRLNTKATPSP